MYSVLIGGTDMTIKVVCEKYDITADTLNIKTCSNGGYQTAEDFDFCPKCGERL